MKEGATLRKQHKSLDDMVVVIELATHKKSEFVRIKRFAFSGERSAAIALHRYGPAAPEPVAGAPTPSKGDDKPQGSDLIVVACDEC